uniref:Vacuolar protein sorting-associated protein 51 homolog n=2 Tax=Canis lupus familiaris TaxID=9615 RepID=A0A8I3PX53_CANLF
ELQQVHLSHRHHPEDEERLSEDGRRNGPAGHQHGGDHGLQRAHQRHPAGPPRAHHQAGRGPRAAAEAAVPLRAALVPHQVCGAGRLRAGGALPGPRAGRAAAVPAPALLPRHPGRLPGDHGSPGSAAAAALQVWPRPSPTPPGSWACQSAVCPTPHPHPRPRPHPHPHPEVCGPSLHRHLPPFREGGSGAPEQAECVELLLALGEPAEELCDEFLANARGRLEAELRSLEAELGPSPPAPDVLEFTDHGGSGFVGGLCQVASAYQELFAAQGAAGAEKLTAFAQELGGRYFALVERRLAQEQGSGDNSLLVRALDRFHRRLRAPGALLAAAGLAEAATEIVERVARERLGHHLQGLRAAFLGCLTDVRQALAAPRLAGKEGPGLAELLANVASSILSHIKASLAAVHLFTAKEVSFSNKPYFRGEFCSQGVREGLIVGFIRSMCQTAQSFCDSPGEKGGATPPALLLLLSRLCLDYETATISYILTLTDEQFLVQDQSPVTPVSTLCAEARETARRLLTHYVKVQGLVISQMLRKSVETRDWLSTLEPRNVRAVMKRVVEDTTAIDVQVGLLYEEGVRKAQSSDSSKRTFSVYSSSRQQGRYAPSYTPSAPMDTNLLSNIQKLFSERIDVFSPVEFNKVSVLTGIIKISLKTLLECVRLRTFGRFGLQQVQVDCHFLQLYLWRFVADEELVHLLLDEVVASAALRCPDPVPMEPSVVEVICERG